MSTRDRSFYDVLGVSRDASQEEIRRAYRRLARKHHPDVSKEADAETRFKEISEAHDVLGDPDKRAAYDRFGARWREAQAAGTTAGAGGGSRRRARPRGAGPDARVVYGDEDLESMFGEGQFADVFGDLFGRGGGAGGFSMRGPDLEVVLDLALEEAARGGRRWLSLSDGRSVEVEIPRGVADGDVVRVAGEGAPGIGGGPPGDLLVRVRLRPHPRFRVTGRDLSVEVPVSPADAALGTTAEVPTLGGTARTKIPPGTSSGRRLRLRGKGLPNPSGPPGDLYATVKIVVPTELSAQERAAYEELRRVSRSESRSRAA
jgi:curved DNA-binding protein